MTATPRPADHDAPPASPPAHESGRRRTAPARFEDAWRIACECGVLMGEREGRTLFELARAAPGHVLEVGSYHGGSAVLLGLAGARRLSLIEPDPRPLLLHALARCGLLHRARLYGFRDHEVWPFWRSGLSLLFLDHDHKYLPVRNSLVGWRRHLRPGARVAIHDYHAFPEVRRAVDELAPGLTIVDGVENLVVATWSA